MRSRPSSSRRSAARSALRRGATRRASLSLDLEVDGRMSLGAAHALATKLESAIRDELGSEMEVDTHIEPLRIAPMAGHDETPETLARIERTLSTTAALARGGGE